MYPAAVFIGVLDVQPAAFAFDNLKWDASLDGKQDFVAGTRAGADVASVFLGDNSLNFLDQFFVHPALVILEVFEVIPFTFFFNH